MAKKKNTKNNPTQKLSPEKFIKEKARSQKLDKCYVTPGWQENGIAEIFITRKKANNNYVLGAFLVDTFCLGVKDVMIFPDLTPLELEEKLNHAKDRVGLDEITYNEAHNIIYGAIEFAKEAGIEPSKEFNLGQYILEEDNDEIPIIEYEFGRDGKHILFVSEYGYEKRYIPILKKNLGDNFHFVMPYNEGDFDEDDEEFDDFEDIEDDEFFSNFNEFLKNCIANDEGYPSESYSYQYPDYPTELKIKHRFIADELLSPDNNLGLSDEVVERILRLPADEAAADLSAIIYYTIGHTYETINNEEAEELTDGSILHAILLLSHIAHENGLDALLEIGRQNILFTDFHLYDFTEYLSRALYACGQNHVEKLVSYIYESGLENMVKVEALTALTMIAIRHPERCDEIIEIYRRLLQSFVTRIPKLEGCDAFFAEAAINEIINLRAEELIPEIKRLYELDLVAKKYCGDFESVVQDMKENLNSNDTTYNIPSIQSVYASIIRD